MSSLRLQDCVCVCWICSLDGVLPLGQEALISYGGGVGRIRSGGLSSGPSLMLFETTEGADLLQRLCPPTQGRAGWRALVRRPRLRLEAERRGVGVGNTAGSLVTR